MFCTIRDIGFKHFDKRNSYQVPNTAGSPRENNFAERGKASGRGQRATYIGTSVKLKSTIDDYGYKSNEYPIVNNR